MNPLAWMQLTISLPLAVKLDIIGVVVVIKIQDVGFIHQRAVENMQLQCLSNNYYQQCLLFVYSKLCASEHATDENVVSVFLIVFYANSFSTTVSSHS